MLGRDPQISKQEVRDIFDGQASYYAQERGQSPWFNAQLKIAFEMLASERGLLLALGCAAGAEVEPLQARGFRVVGIDYSPEMIRLAQQRFGGLEGVSFCRSDAESLPFAAGSFDQVVCLGLFEYLSTYERCLGEIFRVLRPGGVAIVSVPTRISLDRLSVGFFNYTLIPLWRGMKRLMGKRPSGKSFGRSWNGCFPWQFPRLLRKYGLKFEGRAYSGFILFPLGALWPALEYRLFVFMERFSKSSLHGWMLSQYMVCARKTAPF